MRRRARAHPPETTSRSPGAANSHRKELPARLGCSAIHWPVPPHNRCRLLGPSASTPAHSQRRRLAQAPCLARQPSRHRHGATFPAVQSLAWLQRALELHSCNEVLAAQGENTSIASRESTMQVHIAPSAAPSAAAPGRSGSSRNPEQGLGRLPVSSPLLSPQREPPVPSTLAAGTGAGHPLHQL